MTSIIFSSAWPWFAITAVLLVMEIILPGVFLVWLGAGAAVVGAAMVALPNASPLMQLGILGACVTGSIVMGLYTQKRIHSSG